jgi:DNA-binding NtrC family response regulator
MNIVVVEHDARLRSRLVEALRTEGHAVTAVASSCDAIGVLARETVDLVICDIGYPATPALDFLTECRASDHDILVIMTGPRGDDDAALETMRRGAYDYIPKPFRIDHAVLVVRKAIEQEELRREVQRLRDELERTRTTRRPTPATVRTPTPAPVRAATPGSVSRIDEDLSVKRRKAALERTLIRRALERTGGNRTRAARLLDLSHRALLYKIREYGLAG